MSDMNLEPRYKSMDSEGRNAKTLSIFGQSSYFASLLFIINFGIIDAKQIIFLDSHLNLRSVLRYHFLPHLDKCGDGTRSQLVNLR